jgi:hypothetical protein
MPAAVQTSDAVLAGAFRCGRDRMAQEDLGVLDNW